MCFLLSAVSLLNLLTFFKSLASNSTDGLTSNKEMPSFQQQLGIEAKYQLSFA